MRFWEGASNFGQFLGHVGTLGIFEVMDNNDRSDNANDDKVYYILYYIAWGFEAAIARAGTGPVRLERRLSPQFTSMSRSRVDRRVRRATLDER